MLREWFWVGLGLRYCWMWELVGWFSCFVMFRFFLGEWDECCEILFGSGIFVCRVVISSRRMGIL